jgi:nitrite transporter NirC
MCGLLLGLLLPHGEAITWGGYWYNLGLATLGNVVGGAVFVAGLYWAGSPGARDQARRRTEATPPPGANGVPAPSSAPALAER